MCKALPPSMRPFPNLTQDTHRYCTFLAKDENPTQEEGRDKTSSFRLHFPWQRYGTSFSRDPSRDGKSFWKEPSCDNASIHLLEETHPGTMLPYIFYPPINFKYFSDVSDGAILSKCPIFFGISPYFLGIFPCRIYVKSLFIWRLEWVFIAPLDLLKSS